MMDIKSNWIPCSKKNGPDKQEIVLVTVPPHFDEYGVEYYSGVVCAYTITTPKSGTRWYRSDGVTIGELGRLKPEPIAWMPLPKPYEQYKSKEKGKINMTVKDCCDLMHKGSRIKNDILAKLAFGDDEEKETSYTTIKKEMLGDIIKFIDVSINIIEQLEIKEMPL